MNIAFPIFEGITALDAGSPDKAPAHVLAQVRERMKSRMEAAR